MIIQAVRGVLFKNFRINNARYDRILDAYIAYVCTGAVTGAIGFEVYMTYPDTDGSSRPVHPRDWIGDRIGLSIFMPFRLYLGGLIGGCFAISAPIVLLQGGYHYYKYRNVFKARDKEIEENEKWWAEKKEADKKWWMDKYPS